VGIPNHPEDFYRETHFLFAYGTEAIIPTEIGRSNYLTTYYTSEGNYLGLKENLNHLI
jgi:hypothetical protein